MILIIFIVLMIVWAAGYFPVWLVEKDDWSRKIETRWELIGHNFIPFYWWYKYIREYVEKQIELFKRLK